MASPITDNIGYLYLLRKISLGDSILARKVKRKFKVGQTIVSQLPCPNSPKSGNRYKIKDIKKDCYIITDVDGKKPEEIPFNYIEQGCYLDGKYTPNYILLEDADGTYTGKNADKDHRSDSKGSRKKAKSKAHRDVPEDSGNTDDCSEPRTAPGSGKGCPSSSGKSPPRPGRKNKEKGPHPKRGQ